jgi:hypothetical protein
MQFGPVSNELSWDADGGYYSCLWETEGTLPSDDYGIETTLTDQCGNTDLNGLPTDPDVTIVLVDTTPPVVTDVAYRPPWLDVEPGRGTGGTVVHEAGEFMEIVVREQDDESDCRAALTVSSMTTGLEITLEPEWDDDRDLYAALWDTRGAPPSDDYIVESTLEDPYGNRDDDGMPGDDLTIILRDTRAPVILSVTAEATSGIPGGTRSTFECGTGILFRVTEMRGEQGLGGSIILSGGSTPPATIAELTLTGSSDQPGAYEAVWLSRGNPPGEYGTVAVLTDGSGNEATDDSLRISLRDTTPPPQVTDLVALESADEPGAVSLTWEGLEPGGDCLVFRFGPFTNVDDVQPATSEILDVEPSCYTDPDAMACGDVLPADGSSYRFIVAARDMHGNVNRTITTGNVFILTMSTPATGDEIDGHPTQDDAEDEGPGEGGDPGGPSGEGDAGGGGKSGDAGGDILPWWLPLLVGTLIIAALLLLVIARKRKKTGAVADEETDGGPGDQTTTEVTVEQRAPLVASPVVPIPDEGTPTALEAEGASSMIPPAATPASDLPAPAEVPLLPPAGEASDPRETTDTPQRE